MDIIFAGLLVFGLQKFVEGSRELAKLATRDLLVALLAAAGVTGFFVYDVTIHHVLTSRALYPFQQSGLSALRFSLDIVLAFDLALILLPGLQPKPWMATLRILFAASVWHVGAILWHLLAVAEHGRKVRIRSGLLPHAVFPLLYWVSVLSTATALRQGREPLLRAVNQPNCLAVLSVLFLGVAIWRTGQMIRRAPRVSGRTDWTTP